MPSLSARGWIASACFVSGALWACSSDENDLFSDPARGGSSGSESGGSETGGSSGSSTGGTTGGSATGGASGSSSGGDGTGGTTTGGTTGDGGAAAESGSDSGGTATGGAATGGTTTGGATTGGAGMGGAGTAGAGMGGAGISGMGGAGTGGSGKAGGGGKAGAGGMPGDCEDDGDCAMNAYCKKAMCDAAKGTCQPRGPECRGNMTAFEPVCGCDHITYWNTCAIEHDGINVASTGECTGSNRPTCTRDGGGDSCPSRSHAHCYRPVEMCGDTSPTTGVCWVLPAECPENEPQDQRYCGGTAGSARCIGLCEVIEAENSFRRDSAQCQ
jgi:hypothetical protein